LAIDCEGISVRWVKLGGMDAKWRLDGDTLRVVCGEFSGDVEIGFSGKVAPDSVVGIYAAPYEGGRIITTQFGRFMRGGSFHALTTQAIRQSSVLA